MSLYQYGLRRADIDALETLPRQAAVGLTAGWPSYYKDAIGRQMAPVAQGLRDMYAKELDPNAPVQSPTAYGSVLRREYPGLFGSQGIYHPSDAAMHPAYDPIDAPGYFDRHVDPRTGFDNATGMQYNAEMKQVAVAKDGGPTAFHPLDPGGGFPGANMPVENNYLGNSRPFLTGIQGAKIGATTQYPFPPGAPTGAYVPPAAAGAPAPAAPGAPAAPTVAPVAQPYQFGANSRAAPATNEYGMDSDVPWGAYMSNNPAGENQQAEEGRKNAVRKQSIRQGISNG